MDLLWLWIPLLGSLVMAELSRARPVHQDETLSPEDQKLAEEYLRRFYNLQPSRGKEVSGRRSRSTPAMEEKIREMQSFFGLKETGQLDHQTLEVMRKPRCGVPDVENYSFYAKSPKWENRSITFMIDRYTTDMRREDVDKSFISAMKMWSDAAPLNFIRVDHNPADIVLSFARRTHGDFFPFDGPRGVLAHAFHPGKGIGGDVHFDEDETWTAGSRGYNLFAVAAHELGHSLGLSHSKDPSAVMYPSYRSHSRTQSSLSRDDMLGIQKLYGIPRREAEQQPVPDKCDPRVALDAALMIGHDIVFFTNRQVWRTTGATPWKGHRESVGAHLQNINAHVDAAYDIPVAGMVYIFSGNRYFVVRQSRMQTYAGSIHEYGFPASVKQVDAAVHISEYGKTVFFIGATYYRYDERRRRMDPGFPRLIQADWPGIPRKVNAALKLQGNIYIFSGAKSYQYNIRQNRVVNVIPANALQRC